jgi:hypothetical protein
MIENLPVVIYSYLGAQLFLGKARNKIVLQNPQWKLSIFHAAQQ